jgi:NTP pyrophosphatase (non-canonical NTP hydrolase)
MGEPLDLEEVKLFLRKFAAERDWNQFHTPKNLAMALAGEAGELLEVFQWLTSEESGDLDAKRKRAAADELADVLQYVVRLADVLDVDLAEALWRKLHENEGRYPAADVTGSAVKQPRAPDLVGVPGPLADLIRSLVGTSIGTVDRGNPNWITGFDAQSLFVETERSREQATGPQPVPLAWLVASYQTLIRQGSFTRDDLGERESHRSALIFAVLAQLPGVRVETQPIRLIWSPIQDSL